MRPRTPEIHEAFLRPFGDRVTPVTPLDDKPLLLDLHPPLPPRIRLYLYSLSPEGTTRYKSSLRLRGQRQGEYRSFDHTQNRIAVLAAYNPDLDVFVLWDATLHPRFKYGGNVQVSTTTVMKAAASGYAEQTRWLTGVDAHEQVFACKSPRLPTVLERRVICVGGVSAE